MNAIASSIRGGPAIQNSGRPVSFVSRKSVARRIQETEIVMKRLFMGLVLVLALIGASTPPALACGTVHLPNCGASGNFC